MATERHLFSTRIEFNERTFYVADLDIMRDTEGTLSRNRIEARKFVEKVDRFNLWNRFEVKSFLYRNPNENAWKMQFLYVRLLEGNQDDIFPGLRRDHIRLIHEIRPLNNLGTLVEQLVEGYEIVVDGIHIPLDLRKNMLRFESHRRQQSFPRDFGLDNACFVLEETGDRIQSLSTPAERLMLAEISDEFSSLADAARTSLGLIFWNGWYDPFIINLAPIPIAVTAVAYSRNRLVIRTDCSMLADSNQLEAVVYRYDVSDNQVGRTLTLTDFIRVEGGPEVVLDHAIRLEDNVTFLRLYVKYIDDIVEECFLKREDMRWVRT
jgi:hypothetical protein